MKIRFFIYENESLLPSENMSVYFVEGSTDNETKVKTFLYEAKIKSISDIGIKMPDGTIKRIKGAIQDDEYVIPVEWYYSYF